MASASWALLPGGKTLFNSQTRDRVMCCDGPVSREAAMVYPCTSFFMLVPALFLFNANKFATISVVRCNSTSVGFPCCCVSRTSGVVGPKSATCPS